MAIRTFFAVIVLCAAFGAQASPDTVSVYFSSGNSLLGEAARQQLDSAIYYGRLADQQTLRIIGYADEIGDLNYNLKLSRERARAVNEYLVQSGFHTSQITLVTGKGEQGAASLSGVAGNQNDRRVDIIVGQTNNIVILPQPAPAIGKSATKAPALDLSKAVVGETRTLQGIHFQGGSPWILPQSCDALDSLFLALRQAPAVRIRIEGHVCCNDLQRTATDERNAEKLSEERARVIYSFLVERGIAADRLEYKGFGARRPLVFPELSEANRINNRRVDIRIIQ